MSTDSAIRHAVMMLAPHRWKPLLFTFASAVSLQGCGGESDTPSSINPPASETPNDDNASLPLGTLIEREACDALPEGTCRVFTVECFGSGATNVALRLTPPSTGPRRATVLFASGSAGITPYFGVSEQEEPVAWTIGDRLRASGYATLERVWLDPAGGWFGAEADSLLSAGCRLATVVEQVRSELTPSEPLCAVGSSAGSLELSLLMGPYEGSKHLDHVTYVSGPLGRVDLGCSGTWNCAGALTGFPPTCSPPECAIGQLSSAIELLYGTGTCGADSAALDLLRDHSPSSALSSATGTPADFIWGADDCLGIAVSGRAYAEELNVMGGEVQRMVLSGVGHEVHRTPAGADAIVQRVQDGCVRSAP